MSYSKWANECLVRALLKHCEPEVKKEVEKLLALKAAFMSHKHTYHSVSIYNGAVKSVASKPSLAPIKDELRARMNAYLAEQNEINDSAYQGTV